MDDEPLSVNLSVLAKLNISEKLNTRQSLFKIQSSYKYVPEFVVRFIMGSSRHGDFARIRSLYAQAFGLIHEPRIQRLVADSLKGLRNLRVTYQDDPTLLSRIDILIQDVSHKLPENATENDAEKNSSAANSAAASASDDRGASAGGAAAPPEAAGFAVSEDTR